MTVQPRLRKAAGRWVCSLSWLPDVVGLGETPRAAYSSWKQAYFAVHPSVVVQALWAYRGRSTA